MSQGPEAAVGYSGTPLPRKLGLKAGQAVAFVALPPELAGLAEAEAFARVERVGTAAELAPAQPLDLIHAFYLRESDLRAALARLRATITASGMIWISWPKKASKVPTDITEDVVRRLALQGGLVDVKVCAVSEVWSGLKLVIPVAMRGVR